MLAGVSFIDELRPMPSSLRLALHLCAAGVLVWYVLSPMHPAEIALLVLAVAWVTTLYNLWIGNSLATMPRNARGCGVFRVGERCFSP